MTIAERLDRIEDAIEEIVSGIAERLAPWLMDAPVAYLAGFNIVKTFGWPIWLGILAGGGTELLGLACTRLALKLRDYNATKRVSDPVAPCAMAWAMVGLYFGGSLVLALLNTFTGLRIYALLVFPTLGAVGTFTHAMSLDHKRRLATIAEERLERKSHAQPKVAQPVGQPATRKETRGVRVARTQMIMDLYRDNPHATQAEVAQRVGITPQAVSKQLRKLELAGTVSRHNGSGIIVDDGAGE